MVDTALHPDYTEAETGVSWHGEREGDAALRFGPQARRRARLAPDDRSHPDTPDAQPKAPASSTDLSEPGALSGTQAPPGDRRILRSGAACMMLIGIVPAGMLVALAITLDWHPIDRPVAVRQPMQERPQLAGSAAAERDKASADHPDTATAQARQIAELKRERVTLKGKVEALRHEAEAAQAASDALAMRRTEVAPEQAAVAPAAPADWPASIARVPGGTAAEPVVTETPLSQPAPPPVSPPAVQLPLGASARVVLRYSRGNAATYARSIEFGRLLRDRGFTVTDPVAVPTRITADSIGYFYAEDRPSADAAHKLIGIPSINPHRPAPHGQLPRPGTIEIAVAGP